MPGSRSILPRARHRELCRAGVLSLWCSSSSSTTPRVSTDAQSMNTDYLSRRVDLVTYLPLEFLHKVEGDRWTGQAVVPHQYLPPSVSRFNAYAIHGAEDGEEDLAWEDDKIYEALFPVDNTAAAPDFHNLKAFKEINLEEIGVAVSEDLSDIWKAALEGKQLSGLLP